MPDFEQGRYWGKLIEQKLGKTSNGNPQILLRFAIVGAINPADPGGDLMPAYQLDRTVYRVITPNSLQWVMQDMAALGFEGKKLSALDPNQAAHVDLTGREIELLCKHETYEGILRERWSISRPGGSMQTEELDAEGKRRLDALWATAAGANQPAAAAAPAAAPQPAPKAPAAQTPQQPTRRPPPAPASPPAEDEIPF